MKTNYLSRIIYTLLWIDYIHKVDSSSNEYYNKKK